jgi:membrane-associated protein
MEFLHKLKDLLLHLGDDAAWQAMIEYIGIGRLYAVLFLIVFVETGFVVMPFLPGDSLLFAIGAVSARSIGLRLEVIAPMLVAAALLGDNVNYWIGRSVGKAVLHREKTRFLNRKHLLRAHEFYERYGPKTVILARFVPIVRTFSPFVAGVAAMNYAKFLLFSVVGAVLWVAICTSAGYYFGGFAFVKKRFELVIVAIVIISVLPMVIEVINARRKARRGVIDRPGPDAISGEAPSARAQDVPTPSPRAAR